MAIRIVNLYKYLCSEKNESVLSKQILRIGANIAESECAFSRKEFASKIYIALKECNETAYWLELLKDTDYLSEAEYDPINADCLELRRLLQATTKTLTKKQ